MIDIIPIVLLVLGLCLLVYLLRSGERRQSSRQTRHSSSDKLHRSGQKSFSVSNRGLYRKLLKLANGNQQTAERLLKNVQLRNPDRSEQWCLEKAIWDLERDRRRR